MPDCNDKDPFLQLDLLAKLFSRTQRKQVQRRVKNGMGHAKKCLIDLGGDIGYHFPDPFQLDIYLTKNILIVYKEYLMKLVESKQLSIATCYSYHKDFRNAVQFASDNGFTDEKNFIDASIPYPMEINKVIDSYSEDEIASILAAINLENNLWNRDKGMEYVKSGVGQDPRIRSYLKKGLDHSKYGWKCFDNCVWYFEHVMNCDFSYENRLKYVKFYAALGKLGGPDEFFIKIGITRDTTIQNIGPPLLKLAYLTGLNPTSLFELKIDCLIENDTITNAASLRYSKNRSGGTMNYPICKFDDDLVIQDLKQKQFLQIKKVIDQIKTMTVTLRKEAPDQLKDLLFLFSSKSQRKFGSIISVGVACLSRYNKYLVKKYGLKNSYGEELELTVRRFRSTRLNLMSLEGRSEFEIQAVAGHQSIRTTFNYLRIRNLEPELEKETRISLTKVYDNMRWAKKVKPKILKENESKTDSKIYKGVICDCKNVYDPPAEVKKSENYREGQACTFYNMCLSCPNVVITKFHLPILFNYRDEILVSESFNSGEIPHHHIYKRSLAILNSILDEEYSEFSSEELYSARRIAELDKKRYLDPLLYQPTLL